MIVLGLTGGIGMGKSTVAGIFRRAGIPVFDADRAVHALQSPGGAALAPIAKAFPSAVSRRADGKLVLDRDALRRSVLADATALKRLESLVHPLVRMMERRFLRRARGKRIVALDIPLLLETGGDKRVDCVVVVSAPRGVQIARVLHRGRMPRAQVEAIIARQMPDAEKRRRADYVIRTGLSRGYALRATRRLILSLRA